MPVASLESAATSTACRAPASVPRLSETSDRPRGSPVRWGKDVSGASLNQSKRCRSSLKHSSIRSLHKLDNPPKRIGLRRKRPTQRDPSRLPQDLLT